MKRGALNSIAWGLYLLLGFSSPKMLHAAMDPLAWVANLNSEDLIEPHALKQWHLLHSYTAGIPLSPQQPRPAFKCGNSELYPTHPGQELKQYHVYLKAQFHHQKISAHSPLCRMTTTNKSHCLLADSLHFVVLSDTYRDRCGHMYRGVQKRVFIGQDETMATLYSAGRTLYENPHSEFKYDFETGPTYATHCDDFEYLLPLFEADDFKIFKLVESALKAFTFDPTTLLFQSR